MNGELHHIGRRSLGLETYHYYQCADCGTEYQAINGRYDNIRCNGFAITHCPWCCEAGNPSKRASETRKVS